MILKSVVLDMIASGKEHGNIAEGQFKGAEYVKDGNTRWLICSVTGDGYEKYLLPLKKVDQTIIWVCKKAYEEIKKNGFKDYLQDKGTETLQLLISVTGDFENTLIKNIKAKVQADSKIPDFVKNMIYSAIDEADFEFDQRLNNLDAQEIIKKLLDSIFKK